MWVGRCSRANRSSRLSTCGGKNVTALATKPELTLSPQGLLAAVLAESRELTAVERFAKEAAHDTAPAARYYRDLIPTGLPGVGQQYAFEVDLDRLLRLQGVRHRVPFAERARRERNVARRRPADRRNERRCRSCSTSPPRAITASNRRCSIACPVNAYEKDPVTGIVKHLDDQCFGCQYCTLACPYDVPKYHARRESSASATCAIAGSPWVKRRRACRPARTKRFAIRVVNTAAGDRRLRSGQSSCPAHPIRISRCRRRSIKTHASRCRANVHAGRLSTSLAATCALAADRDAGADAAFSRRFRGGSATSAVWSGR